MEPRNGFDDVWLEAREVPLPEGDKAHSVACSGALTAVLTGVASLHTCRNNVIGIEDVIGRERLTGLGSPWGCWLGVQRVVACCVWA